MFSDDSTPPPNENPYATPHAGEPLPSVAEAAVGTPKPGAKPRLWTLLLVLAAALVATIGGQIVGSFAIVGWYFAQGGNPKELASEIIPILLSPPAFVLLTWLSQAGLASSALVPAWLSPEPLRARLGLGRPRLPAWGYPVVVIGALASLAAGVFAAWLIALVIPANTSVGQLYDQMSAAWAIPFVVTIAVGPGVCEELLFRGYVQQRLLARWNPWVAILVASAAFALFHITPHAIALAFIIGIWLGVLAWRTGSIIPGMLCHGFINGSWNVWHVGASLGYWSRTPTLAAAVGGGLLIAACFALSVWLVVHPVPASSDPTAPAEHG